MIYDVAILGGGIVGCAILNKLTRIGKKCILIEKNNDVATGTTKANSGIVHAGFDAKPNTLKARLNVRGAKLYPRLCSELNVPLINNGALVVGNDLDTINQLYQRGIENGVNGLEVLNRDSLLKMVPTFDDSITCGLLAKTSSIVSPYSFAIALAEESVLNGGEVVFNYSLKYFNKYEDYYKLSNGDVDYYARKIIVCVGSKHNEVAEILNTTKYDIKFRRGEYYLLDKGAMDIGGYTIFPLPSKDSKGVLVSPTTSGNLIVGPTSILTQNDNTITTKDALDMIASLSINMLKNVNLKKNIRVFSGIRTLVGDDFVIEKDKKCEDVINITGICSPGLTAAPAIAEEVLNILQFENIEVENLKRRPKYIKTNTLSTQQLDELIKTDSRYGKIICRCENITEGEIIDAINSPLKPTSIDAIKRRTRAGMGRCQGGFCALKVMELISKERNIPLDKICKENIGSEIIVGDIE